MKAKCLWCGAEVDVEKMDLDEHDSHAYCPHCERSAWDASKIAQMYAEKNGIYEYKSNGLWIEYWSFFTGEGFRFIRHNLVTDEENRDVLIQWEPTGHYPVPAFLKGPNGGALYNYNCG